MKIRYKGRWFAYWLIAFGLLGLMSAVEQHDLVGLGLCMLGILGGSLWLCDLT